MAAADSPARGHVAEDRNALSHSHEFGIPAHLVRECSECGTVSVADCERSRVPKAEFGFETGARFRNVADREMARRDVDLHCRHVARCDAQ